MKAELEWEFFGNWPTPCGHGYSYMWQTTCSQYSIRGTLKSDGSPSFDIFVWDDDINSWLKIEMGWSTLRRAMIWTERYAKGKAAPII